MPRLGHQGAAICTGSTEYDINIIFDDHHCDGVQDVANCFGVWCGGRDEEWLAIVIIGGLLSSLFLTLVIVPVVFTIFIRLEEKFSKKEKNNYEELMVADYQQIYPDQELEFD